jgi:hypothetical protein
MNEYCMYVCMYVCMGVCRQQHSVTTTPQSARMLEPSPKRYTQRYCDATDRMNDCSPYIQRYYDTTDCMILIVRTRV